MLKKINLWGSLEEEEENIISAEYISGQQKRRDLCLGLESTESIFMSYIFLNFKIHFLLNWK